jgi:hypothetical protein
MTSVKALLARRKKFDREDHAERVRLAILEVDVDGLKDAVHLKDAVQSSLGQQKVTVEHVHVHSGGQAVVGVVEAPGGRGSTPSACWRSRLVQTANSGHPGTSTAPTGCRLQ